MFDPYCPQRYRCKDYEIEAVWFDGRNAGDLRFTIDLEHGTMDKCVAVYFRGEYADQVDCPISDRIYTTWATGVIGR
jgi:hypothetical protein